MKRIKDPVDIARARLADAEKLLAQAEDAAARAEGALAGLDAADVEAFDAAISARDAAVARRDELKARVAKAEHGVQGAKDLAEGERRALLSRQLESTHAALADGDRVVRSRWARTPVGQELKVAATASEVIKAIQKAGKVGW